MLLNLLKKIEVSKITIAGFDGFATDKQSNYADNSFNNDRYIEKFETMNKEISLMLTTYVKTLSGKCSVNIVTPSIFSSIIEKAKIL